MELPVPKQFVEIEGKPLFAYALRTFVQHPRIDKIALVIPPLFRDYVLNYLDSAQKPQSTKHSDPHFSDFSKVILVDGADTRHRSIWNGLKALEDSRMEEREIRIPVDLKERSLEIKTKGDSKERDLEIKAMSECESRSRKLRKFRHFDCPRHDVAGPDQQQQPDSEGKSTGHDTIDKRKDVCGGEYGCRGVESSLLGKSHDNGEAEEENGNGVERPETSNNDEVVVIHDAARPFLDSSTLNAVIDAAVDYGAAGVVRPLVSTVIKPDRDGFLQETLVRGDYRASEMPQAFSFPVISEAYSRCSTADLDFGTECLEIARKYGDVRAKLVEGGDNLWKVTYAKDLEAVRNHLKSN